MSYLWEWKFKRQRQVRSHSYFFNTRAVCHVHKVLWHLEQFKLFSVTTSRYFCQTWWVLHFFLITLYKFFCISLLQTGQGQGGGGVGRGGASALTFWGSNADLLISFPFQYISFQYMLCTTRCRTMKYAYNVQSSHGCNLSH